MMLWLSTAFAADFCVGADVPGSTACSVVPSLELAVDGAGGGDTIWLPSGAVLTESVNVSDAITVRSEGPLARATLVTPPGAAGVLNVISGTTTVQHVDVDVEASARAFRVAAATLLLEDVHITDADLVGVNTESAVLVTNATFEMSSGSITGFDSNRNGGQISVDAGTVTLTDSVFTGGRTTGNRGGAGVYFVGDGLTVTGCEFRDHEVDGAAEGGAAVYIRSATVPASISDTQFIDNVSLGNRGGGALYVHTGSLSVAGSTFTGNHASNVGGAVALRGDTGVHTFTGNTFTDNTTDNRAGALDLLNGSLTSTANHFEGNHAQDNGGAIATGEGWVSTDDTFCENTSDAAAGGVYVRAGTATLTRPILLRNTSVARGGGMFLANVVAMIDHGTFVRNRSGPGDSDALRMEESGVAVFDTAFLHHPGTAVFTALGTWENNAWLENGVNWISPPVQTGEVVNGASFVSPNPPCERSALAPGSASSALVGADRIGGDIGAVSYIDGPDGDGDGWIDALDCAAADATIFPGAAMAPDSAGNGIDENCSGFDECFPDGDEDGYGDDGLPVNDLEGDGCSELVEGIVIGGDCDDSDGAVSPAAIPDASDVADDLDRDCDGSDECFLDWDGDGSGTPSIVPGDGGCLDPGLSAFDDDCDDADPAVFPSALEVCNAIDDDCDGHIDAADPDADVTEWYPDVDGDGYGDQDEQPVQSCLQPSGTVANGLDCDDTDEGIAPLVPEACVDGIDNDCDGLIDMLDPDFVEAPVPYWADGDGDGFGDPAVETVRCPESQPAGAVPASLGADCDDTDPEVAPLAPERCNQVDDDCDGDVDEELGGVVLYADADLDGYGDPNDAVYTCDPLPDRIDVAGDCDDTDDTIRPGEPDRCDGIDRDCDGDVEPLTPCEPITGCRCASSSPAGSWAMLLLLALCVRGSRRPGASTCRAHR